MGHFMILKSFRINHYRSIETELKLDNIRGLSLVGPNNCGKTNILKAIELFFSAKEKPEMYSFQQDQPFESKSGQSSFVATFEIDNNDQAFLDEFNEIVEMIDIEFTEVKDINLYLTFSKNGNASYNFYKGVKRKDGVTSNQYTYVERKLVDKLLSKFECIYVPSAKSVDQLYEHLVLPYLRKVASDALNSSIQLLYNGLDNIAESVDHELKQAGIIGYSSKFTIPDNKLERVISRFGFSIVDTKETEIFSKGMGIQCAALFSTFSWITKRKVDEGKQVVWLIEEPESFLHPELTRSCEKILENLNKVGYVVKTTHSLAFVSQDPSMVIGVDKDNGRTVSSKFKTYAEATAKIRTSLGIKFSDYFNLDKLNLFVEGPTDREYINWFLNFTKNYEEYSDRWPNLRKARIEDFGGVSFLTGFLRSNYQFIQKEIICISLFDGDYQGMKDREAVQNHIQNKLNVKFRSNKEFVSTRKDFPIEGLIHDPWLIEINELHDDWFKSFSYDAFGNVEPFGMHDNKKYQIFQKFTSMANDEISEWGAKWIVVFDALESAFSFKISELNDGVVHLEGSE